jgi:predicted nucleic acid-binding protein
MNIIALDTSAYSVLKAGHEQAIALVQKASTILLPIVVLGELLGGFENSRFRERNRESLHAFLESDRVQVHPITSETAERYAVIYAYLRSVGRPIPTNDIWIAASAMEHSAMVLTTDKHYIFIPHILVERII